MRRLTCIDLFAGAGGLSEGFVRCGVTPVAHVEYDISATYTLRTRAAYHYLNSIGQLSVYHDYLRGKISRDALYEFVPNKILNTVINAKIGPDNDSIFAKIDKLKGKKAVDIIIGGPPCQAYSIVGRASLKHKNYDERTTLYMDYGKFLDRYRPKIFLFENVPGLLSSAGGKHFENLQAYYEELGYQVEARLLNAIDFNVVQNRSRIIIIGWRKKLKFSYPDFEQGEGRFDRDHIFKDLPALTPGVIERVSRYTARPNAYLKNTQMRNGVSFVTQHVTRPHNERDLEIYKLAIERLSDGHRLKNNAIPESMRTQKNVTSFLDRFKVVDKTPHTMIAHISKDGHHFIHPDIKQCRSISVREAARIQSFPDDYFFEGAKEGVYRSAAFRQIGNAVPPLMAEKIAKSIRSALIKD